MTISRLLNLPEIIQGLPARLRPEVNKAIIKAVDKRLAKRNYI